jgi:hypothetical protein
LGNTSDPNYKENYILCPDKLSKGEDKTKNVQESLPPFPVWGAGNVSPFLASL